MPIPALDIPEVVAYYDEATRLIIVQYGVQLTPHVTARTYQWLMQISEMPEINQARGSIYDFSWVKIFAAGNLMTVKKNSLKMNEEDPRLKNHPVALVVSTKAQRIAVMASMGLTPQQKRKKIVTSQQEANLFISQWHGEEVGERTAV